MSGVLGTAEHAMAAAGSLLKDKGDAFDELKSLLSQVDQKPGVSQLLLMSTLSNFILSKRQDMLGKSPIAGSYSSLPIRNLDINLHGLWCFTNFFLKFIQWKTK
jgi:hypothetical protein